MFFIYLITNKLDGKKYVGQTDNFERRWKIHKRAPRYVHSNKSRRPSVLALAMAKHGVDNFYIEKLASVEKQEDTDEIETSLISWLKTRTPHGYNLAPGGRRGGCGGWSEEAKDKLRLKRLGSNNPMYGRKTSENAKILLVESSRKGWTLERKQKHVALMKKRWEQIRDAK